MKKGILLRMALLGVGMILLGAMAFAQTIYVNSSTGNDTSGDGSSGNPYKTFTKGYSMVSSEGTLDLTGTFTWTDAAETIISSNSGFEISKNITIQGPSGGLAIIQATASLPSTTTSRILTIKGGVTVTIKNLELRNAYTPSNTSGGAIHIYSTANLTVLNCHIHDNVADSGGGINADGTLVMTNSTVSNNVCLTEDDGGAGIYVNGGTIKITNSTICNNSDAPYGGGIYIVGSDDVAILTNCTIAGNSANECGGGICIDDGTLTIKNTIIANNTEGTSSNNGSDIDHYMYNGNYVGTIVDNGYNIVEITNSSSLNGTGTITGEQSNLNLNSTLANNNTLNGTPTLALSLGSVAINAGNSSANGSVSVPTADQRGASRNGTTDIGAYEYEGIFSASAPTTQASNVGFTNTTMSSTTLGWTRGNGNNCAVFMAAASSGTASPGDATTYSASTTFSSGDQIDATGWYCVYNGTGTSVDLSGLSAGTTYRVHVCEYNGSSGSEFYLTNAGTDNPDNVTTPKTIYVDTDATAGANNGTSWANAYTSLQSALGAATNGDQIWVAAGTYKPSSPYALAIDGDRDFHFEMIEGVAIYGGFVGTETSVDDRTDYGESGTNETILSGDIGTTGDNSDNCYHVFYHPATLALTSAAVLNGVSITGGNANGSDPHNSGGGMYNSSCSPTLTNVIITNNTVSSSGGGMNNEYSSPALTNVIISNNSASSSSGFGGGIRNYGSSPTLTNVTISNNSARYGGGIYNNSSSPNLYNCIIWGNSAPIGSEFYIDSGTTTLYYSCYNSGGVQGSITANSSTTSDPKFINAANGDYRVNGTSPCIDTGNDSYNSETYDIRGYDYGRKLLGTDHTQTGTIDMGAYEYKKGTDPPYYMSKTDGDWSSTSVWYTSSTGGTNPDDYTTAATKRPRQTIRRASLSIRT